jgi:hypothetical protein
MIIGITRIVTKGLKKNLGTIPGRHSVHSLQKTWDVTHDTESTAV